MHESIHYFVFFVFVFSLHVSMSSLRSKSRSISPKDAKPKSRDARSELEKTERSERVVQINSLASILGSTNSKASQATSCIVETQMWTATWPDGQTWNCPWSQLERAIAVMFPGGTVDILGKMEGILGKMEGLLDIVESVIWLSKRRRWVAWFSFKGSRLFSLNKTFSEIFRAYVPIVPPETSWNQIFNM